MASGNGDVHLLTLPKSSSQPDSGHSSQRLQHPLPMCVGRQMRVPGTTACGLGFLTTWRLGPKGVCPER